MQARPRGQPGRRRRPEAGAVHRLWAPPTCPPCLSRPSLPSHTWEALPLYFLPASLKSHQLLS